jgi:monovalent cation:proton antiporter-2 (CPA2) family protein
MAHSLLTETAVYLTSAVVAVPVFKRLGLGAVLGYLAAGSVLGPWGLGFVTDPTHTLHFAELGVVLLLFLIGLELRPSRLWAMRYAVFVLGGAQVFLCTLVIGFLAWLTGISGISAFIIGFSLSLSSTAFTLQILAERNQLNTSFGRSAFAILLFQDLIAIPVLAAIPLLAPSSDSASGSAVWGALKAVGAMTAILLGGKWLSRPVLHVVSAAGTREVFLAGALLLVLGVAFWMESIGLSMALGAFLVGVVLSDSEYRHLLEADIEPFKGLLLGLFFISVGTSVDYGLLRDQPGVIFAGVSVLLLTKYAVVFGIGKIARLTTDSARKMATVLPEGGEFAFVLFGVATANGFLTAEQNALLIVIVIASMVFTPLIGLADARFLSRLLKPTTEPFDAIPNESNPVIVAGFGRFGQMVARILRLQGIGFTTLEKDAEQVKTVRKFGAKVYYGDASRLDLLEAAGAKTARYFVLAIDDVEASVKTAALIRQHFPHLRIFARARNRQHAFELMDLGITEFWRETFASSMELSKNLLLELGTPLNEADAIIRRFRAHDENTLIEQHKLHHDEKAVIQYSKQSVQQLLDSVEADRQSKVSAESPS